MKLEINHRKRNEENPETKTTWRLKKHATKNKKQTNKKKAMGK